MLHTYKMKKYIIDQVLFLVIGILVMVYFLYLFRARMWFGILLAAIVLIPLLFVNHRLFALLIDLIIGKKTEEVRFSAKTDSRELQFFREYFCFEWEFRDSRGKTFRLLIPEATKASTISQPKKDRLLKITYYRFSKLLLSWEIIEE